MSITVTGLCKAFDAKPVLHGFGFSLADGETVALMGPSGCGKTTFLRILMGLETPDAGVIEGLRGLRIAPVFQQDRLCPGLSALQNVLLVAAHPAQTAAQAEGLLRELGLHEDDIRRPAAVLSGGQRRRAALARAVLADGGLVLLDEAFKGLDEATAAQAIDFVRRRTQGKMVLAVTHSAAEAAALGARVVEMPARPD